MKLLSRLSGVGLAALILIPALAWSQPIGTPGYGGTAKSEANVWLGTQTFRDTTFIVTDNTTPTKIGKFELSGLSAGTVTLNWPLASGTILTNVNFPLNHEYYVDASRTDS